MVITTNLNIKNIDNKELNNIKNIKNILQKKGNTLHIIENSKLKFNLINDNISNLEKIIIGNSKKLEIEKDITLCIDHLVIGFNSILENNGKIIIKKGIINYGDIYNYSEYIDCSIKNKSINYGGIYNYKNIILNDSENINNSSIFYNKMINYNLKVYKGRIYNSGLFMNNSIVYINSGSKFYNKSNGIVKNKHIFYMGTIPLISNLGCWYGNRPYNKKDW